MTLFRHGSKEGNWLLYSVARCTLKTLTENTSTASRFPSIIVTATHGFFAQLFLHAKFPPARDTAYQEAVGLDATFLVEHINYCINNLVELKQGQFSINCHLRTVPRIILPPHGISGSQQPMLVRRFIRTHQARRVSNIEMIRPGPQILGRQLD